MQPSGSDPTSREGNKKFEGGGREGGRGEDGGNKHVGGNKHLSVCVWIFKSCVQGLGEGGGREERRGRRGGGAMAAEAAKRSLVRTKDVGSLCCQMNRLRDI